MSSGSVEDRILQLEQKVRQLECNALSVTTSQPWWVQVAGAFKDDQVYAAAMKLGTEIRKADPPEVVGERLCWTPTI